LNDLTGPLLMKELASTYLVRLVLSGHIMSFSSAAALFELFQSNPRLKEVLLDVKDNSLKDCKLIASWIPSISFRTVLDFTCNSPGLEAAMFQPIRDALHMLQKSKVLPPKILLDTTYAKWMRDVSIELRKARRQLLKSKPCLHELLSSEPVPDQDKV
jgi:hypothetical protein